MSDRPDKQTTCSFENKNRVIKNTCVNVHHGAKFVPVVESIFCLYFVSRWKRASQSLTQLSHHRQILKVSTKCLCTKVNPHSPCKETKSAVSETDKMQRITTRPPCDFYCKFKHVYNTRFLFANKTSFSPQLATRRRDTTICCTQ